MSRAFFWSRKARAPRALLAWEIGAGFTHAQNLWGVARRLRQIGVECLAALADPRFDAWFRTLGVPVLQTHLWPIMRSTSLLPQSRPTRAFSDILANYGMSQPGNVGAALAHYEAVFDLFQPDIVLCENAFGALLAARGRAPALVFGSTLLFMPPRLGDGFAPIDPRDENPSWPVADVLDGLNEGLGATARSPLLSVTDILDCAAVLPFGPAAFDPYAAYRKELVLPPHCPDLPKGAIEGTGDEIVVYLHEAAQLVDAAMRAILHFPGPVRVYIPALGDDWRARFLARGILVEERMLPLRLIVEKARCLVHHGGVTLTAAALAHAVPQIILARFFENGLAGDYVRERGLGEHCRLDAVDAEWMRAAMDRILGDAGLRARARKAAPEFLDWFSGDPTLAVARKAAEILRLKPPPDSPGDGPSEWSAI